MSQPGVKILAANGIIVSGEKKALRCCLCEVSPSSVDWLKHIETLSHARRLKRFESEFVNLGESLRCQRCMKNFDWKSLKSHAAKCLISPWYRPVDLYKIFFENQTMEWLAKFYCYPCDEIFFDWSEAYVHTSDERHKNQLKAKDPKNDKSLNLLGSNLCYEWLVCDGIFSWYDEKIRCKICDFHSIDIASFDTHVDGARHNKRRVELIGNLKKRARRRVTDELLMRENRVTLTRDENYWCDFCELIVNGLEKVLEHLEEDVHRSRRRDLGDKMVESSKLSRNEPIGREKTKKLLDGARSIQSSLSWDFIVEGIDEELCCKICDDIMLEQFDIQAHIRSNRHLAGLKKFRDNEITLGECNNYYCGFCECYIPGLRNVFLHINGYRHEYWRNDEASAVNDKESKSKSQTIESSVLTKPATTADCVILDQVSLSRDLIVEQSDCDFYCAICDCAIVDTINVRDHIVSSKKHATEIDVYRDNKITFRDDKYWCDYCACKIFRLDQIPPHVNGYGHSIARSQSRKMSESGEEILCHVIGTREKLSHRYIVESEKIAGHAYCEICECLINGYVNIEQHVAGYRHDSALRIFNENKIESRERNVYHCKYCNCEILGNLNVIEHIKGTRHLDAVDKSKEPKKPGTEVSETNDQKDLSPEVTKPKNTKPKDLNPEIRKPNYQSPKVSNPVIQSPKDPSPKIPKSKDPKHPSLEILRPKDLNPKDKKSKDLKDPSPEVQSPKDPSQKDLNLKDRELNNLRPELQSPKDPKPKDLNTKHSKLKDLKSKDIKDPRPEVQRQNDPNQKDLNPKDKKSNDLKDLSCEIQGPKDPNPKDLNFKVPKPKVLKELSPEIPKPEDLKPDPMNPFLALFTFPASLQINGYVHHEITKSQSQELPKSDEITKNIVATSKQILPYRYIVEFNETQAYCKIGACSIGDYVNVEEHIAGYRHVTALKIFNDNKIEYEKNNVYHCEYCNCKLYSNCTVHAHIKGIQHLGARHESKNLMPEDPETKDLKLNDPESKDPESKDPEPKDPEPKDYKHKYVAKINNTDSMTIERGKIRNLVEPVNCSICKIKLANLVKLHAHLAGHFIKEFLGSSDERSNNNEDIDDFSVNESLKMSSNISTESICTIASEGENFDLLENSANAQSKKYIEPGTLERTAKKLNAKRIAKILNFSNNDIYNMSEKFRELELGIKLSYAKFSKNIYCLVCRITTEFTIENYFQHLRSLDHCVYLEIMEADHSRFYEYPDQFSEIDLGLEYMEDISNNLVLCHVCDVIICANDDLLRKHIDEKSHAREHRTMRDLTMINFHRVTLPMKCDWYKVHIYSCVPCVATFRSEVNFVKHMSSKNHLNTMERSINKRRQLVYDFCEACALLWYGYRRTCAYHRDIDTHLWLVRDGYYLSEKLPKSAQELLTVPECFISETIRIYEASIAEEREKESRLIRDIEVTVGRKYCRAKVHMFGSRATGMGLLDCDIDIFLDCGDMYDGKIISRTVILNIMDNVCECLSQEPQTWVVKELIKTCRSPIIKAHHVTTGLSCDISFQNGLAVENTKLIKSYNDAYPLCREMIIFLKGWLTLCKLSGSEGITSYALYWHVIFYLQQETILPTVDELIKIENQSRIIDGWEVGASRDFACNMENYNFTIRELLARFFRFWCNFDHRYDVACPMIGKILKKRVFLCTGKILNDESLYADHVIKSMKREALRIDCPMCVQDPFDLRHNITKAVGKVYVNRFRKYCSYSLDLLLRS